jgi:hypothetical protein
MIINTSPGRGGNRLGTSLLFRMELRSSTDDSCFELRVRDEEHDGVADAGLEER